MDNRSQVPPLGIPTASTGRMAPTMRATALRVVAENRSVEPTCRQRRETGPNPADRATFSSYPADPGYSTSSPEPAAKRVSSMAKYRIGIDLGGTKIEIILLGPDGSELLRERTETPSGYDATLAGIAGLVRAAESRIGVTASVGIGIPGVISPATGLVKNANSIALNGHTFDQDLSAALSREVRVENDANCFPLAEAADGAGAGQSIVFGVIIG